MDSPTPAAPASSTKPLPPPAAATTHTTPHSITSPIASPTDTTTTTSTTPNPQSTASTTHQPPSTTTSATTPFPTLPLPHHAIPQPPRPPPSTTSLPQTHAPPPPLQISQARTAIVASIGNMLDSHLRDRASVLHSNAAAISKQQVAVQRATTGLRRENDKLAKVADDAARKVKELGNVQNWAEVLERDFLVLEETLRLVRGEGEEGSWSGSQSGSSWTGSSRGSEIGDEDVRMHGDGKVDKGKGRERDEDRMDIDDAEPAYTFAGSATADTVMQGSGMGLPSVGTRGHEAPSLIIPGMNTDTSTISLEDDLRDAMAESIADPA